MEELHKSSDNRISTATSRTKSGIRKRSVKKLHLWEESQSVEEENVTEPEEKSIQRPLETDIDATAPDEYNATIPINKNYLDTPCQGGENVQFTRSGRRIRATERFVVK